MKLALAAIAVVLTLAPIRVHAEERVGDAALGALSGAVVLGPIGLVAGAVVGYTAGPSIARSFRANRNLPRHRTHVAKRPAQAAGRQSKRQSAPAAGEVTPQGKGAGGPPPQGFE